MFSKEKTNKKIERNFDFINNLNKKKGECITNKIIRLNKKGFTLIELIVVMAVLGILVLLAAPKFIGFVDRAEEVVIVSDVNVAEAKVSELLITGTKEFDKWDDANISELELVDGETSITNIGYEPLIGSPSGTTNTGIFSFTSLTGITTAHVYLGAYTGGTLPETEEIQYINKTPGPNATACQINGSHFTHFTDKRDTTEYPVTQIGNQCWMAADVTNTSSSCLTTTWSTATYNACRRNPSGIYTGAVHYQWEAARTACPSGWHLPTDAEWKTLEMYLGMTQAQADGPSWRGTNEGEKLKAQKHNGTNDGGFNGTLTGYHESTNEAMTNNNTYGYWWSSSDSTSSNAWSRNLHSTMVIVNRFSTTKANGFSVRCVLGN